MTLSETNKYNESVKNNNKNNIISFICKKGKLITIGRIKILIAWTKKP